MSGDDKKKPKRAISSSDEDEEDPKANKSKSESSAASSSSGSDSDSEKSPPPAKKKKSETSKKTTKDDKKSKSASGGSGGKIKKDSNGEVKFPIDNNKFVTVREFKGKVYVDIREHYEDKGSGGYKPTKKGVCLNPDAWKKLKNLTSDVDEALKLF